MSPPCQFGSCIRCWSVRSDADDVTNSAYQNVLYLAQGRCYQGPECVSHEVGLAMLDTSVQIFPLCLLIQTNQLSI